MENVNTQMTKYDTPIKQAIQHLQGGTGSGGSAAVLRGAWREEDVSAR